MSSIVDVQKNEVFMRTDKASFIRVSIPSLFLALVVLATAFQAHGDGTNCAPAPAGLVGWWQAEGNFNDSAGTNNGQSAGEVSFVSGEVGQAFAFDGTPTSYVEVPDSPSLQITDVVTIEFWVKRLRLTYPSLPYAEYILEKGGDFTGNQVNYSVALHNPSYNYCLHFVFAGGWRGAGSIADTNAWHHCAVVARNGDADPTFYIDGVAQPVTYSEGAPVINLYPSTRPLHIGAMLDPATGWFYYSDTQVDELSIYHRALAAEEIQAIYNAGVAGKCPPPPEPPSIVSQPVDTTVNAGDLATFSVTAFGSSPLSYQWFFGSNPVSGGNQSSLMLSNVQTNDAGTYFVVVSNALGTATSSNAQLTVLTFPPTIQVQPHATNVYVGAPVTLSVGASGSPPLMYQWQKDGVPIPGASQVLFQLLHAQLQDSGLYSVVVSNLYGSITSSNALLTVREPPPCVPPAAGLVSWWRGENNALDGWDSNDGVTVSSFPSYAPGRVGRCFASSVVVVPDALSLHVTNLTLHAWVNGPMGFGPRAIVSKVDYSTPQVPGTQNSFYLGTTNGQLVFQVSSNGAARASASVLSGQILPANQWIFVAATYDGAALRLYINGNLVAQTSYAGGILAGIANLGIGGVPVSSGLPQSFWPFNGLIDEVCLYSRALDDSEIAAIYDSDITGMCLEPPTIVAQPQDQAIPLGEDVKFTVSVLGSRPLRYQWYFNTHVLRGATNAALVLEKLQTNSAGAYSLTVSNALGLAQSAAANLSLLPAPTCETAPSGMISWWPADNSALDVVGTNNALLLTGATYTTGKVGQAFSIFPIFQPVLGGRIQVANSASLNFGSNADFSIEAWVKASPGGPSFVGGRFSPTPSMNIVQKRPTSQTLPGGGYELSLEQGRLAFWLASSDLRTNPPPFISSGPDLRDGMFHHVALSLQRSVTNGGNLYVDGELVLTFDPTSQRGSLANTFPLLIGSAIESIPDVSLRGLVDELTFYSRVLSADEILAIRTAGAAGKCKVHPFITQQPLAQHVLPGGSATFTIIAQGTPNLHYQWRFNNVPLPGATSSAFTRTNVQPIHAGLYSVIVTNGFGSALSSNALLVLNQAPVAVCQDIVVPAGSNCVAAANVDNGSFDPDGEVITLAQVPPGPYPLGTNVVTLIASDPWGATNSCTALVIVLDRTPPTLICPPTFMATNDLNQCGAIVVFPIPTPTDSCSAVTNIICIPPPGSFFPVGATPVQCLAMDAAGNVGSCTFNVMVRDAQRPTITCPADIVVTNAHDAWTSVVQFSPTFSDNCPGVGTPGCNPPSGSAFGVGATTVTCSVADAAGNSSQCTFRVVVHPGNLPPLPLIDVSPLSHFPGNTNLFVIAVNDTDASVTFDGSRSYDVDDTNFLYFWYEDGSVFSTNVVATEDLAVGSHTITLWLDDTFPLGTNSASVIVEVIRPADAVGMLIGMVEAAHLGHRNGEPLLVLLEAAEAAFERGDLPAALNQLRAFQNMVRAQVAPFNPALAKQLIAGTQTILQAFGVGHPWIK